MSGLRKRNVAFTDVKRDEDDSDFQDVKKIGNNDKPVNSTVSPSQSMISPSKIDRMLQAYVKFTSSALNQERCLKVAQYSLWMISRFYRNNDTVRVALEKLSGNVSWARYITRFFGFPSALEGVRSGSWGNPKSLGKAMAWMMAFYYPIEHLAYLKWQAPSIVLPNSKITRLASKASAVSCQFWLAYTVLDIVKSALALRQNQIGTGKALAPAQARNERLQLIREALFTPTAIHYALPNWDINPLLSNLSLNFLFWVESLVCMYQGIASFRDA